MQAGHFSSYLIKHSTRAEAEIEIQFEDVENKGVILTGRSAFGNFN